MGIINEHFWAAADAPQGIAHFIKAHLIITELAHLGLDTLAHWSDQRIHGRYGTDIVHKLKNFIFILCDSLFDLFLYVHHASLCRTLILFIRADIIGLKRELVLAQVQPGLHGLDVLLQVGIGWHARDAHLFFAFKFLFTGRINASLTGRLGGSPQLAQNGAGGGFKFIQRNKSFNIDRHEKMAHCERNFISARIKT